MENYMMINGKRIELTDDQVNLILADETKKSPFDRVEYGYRYYYSNYNFEVLEDYEGGCDDDDYAYDCANYCTDENIMKQHALHMLLNNLLWRYSMTHGGDKIDWDNQNISKYYIEIDTRTINDITYDSNVYLRNVGEVYFINYEVATDAIEEVVKPFIEAHPEFDVTKM